jgi:membrane-bound inhibitor of C-type lysozyme
MGAVKRVLRIVAPVVLTVIALLVMLAPHAVAQVTIVPLARVFYTVTATSGFLAPTGCTTVPYSYTGQTSDGFCSPATGQVSLGQSNALLVKNGSTTKIILDPNTITGSGVMFATGYGTCWTTGASAAGTIDACLKRSATKTVTFDDGAGGVLTNVNILGPLSASTTLKTGATTVASLPTCNSGAQGMRYVVTDANSTTFLSTVAAGGANVVPVVCDGTNWKIG